MDHRECETIEPALSALADRELFGPERETVAGHVAVCDACRRTLEDYRVLGTAFREGIHAGSERDLSAITWPPRPEPASRAPSRALTRWRRLIYDVTRWVDPWPVLAGAAALIALVLGIGLIQPAREPANVVEIERVDAAGPVMVIPGNGGRMTIIWLFDTDDQPDQTPTPI
jgi:anti-sigma factor RsiW